MMSALMTPALLVEEVRSASEAEGLAAGLRRLLASGVPVPCSAGGRTVIPAGGAASVAGWELATGDIAADHVTVTVLPHALAANSGLEMVQVEPLSAAHPRPADAPMPADLLLAAVRLGLTERLLSLAADHLAARTVEGKPLTHKQMLQGVVADAVAEIELCRHGLLAAAGSPVATEALHTGLSDAGWSISTLFGASGYLRDHPVRCLYGAELVHSAWTGACHGTR